MDALMQTTRPLDDPRLADLAMVSSESLAAVWDTTPATVRRWARENRVPAVKLGKAWRFRVSDLRKVMDAGGKR